MRNDFNVKHAVREARILFLQFSFLTTLRHVSVLIRRVYSTIDFARAEALYDLPGDEDNLRRFVDTLFVRYRLRNLRCFHIHRDIWARKIARKSLIIRFQARCITHLTFFDLDSIYNFHLRGTLLFSIMEYNCARNACIR